MMSGISGSSGYSNIYMNQQRPQGPKVDTNDDDALDLQELEAFSEHQAEVTGTTFDAQEIMTKYDTDEDGFISKSEGASMREDNAFNMPEPSELQAQMMAQGGNRPQGPPPGGGGGSVEGVSESSSTIDIDALLKALESDDDEDETTTSAVDASTAALLEALEDTSSEYTAAEIAKYDTNGDGDIDSIEAAAMNVLDPESETDTDNLFKMAMQEAIKAYSSQTTFSAHDFFSKVENLNQTI
jgi:Ca2+-binding EF-hand superfamily protein